MNVLRVGAAESDTCGCFSEQRPSKRRVKQRREVALKSWYWHVFGISLLALSGYVGKYVNYFYDGSIPELIFGKAGLVFLVGIFVVTFFL